VNATNTLTSQTRRQAEASQVGLEQLPGIINQIKDIGDQIGPWKGRLNTLLTTKGGMNNPAFAKLDQSLDAYTSLFVQVHFPRGGQEYRAELRKNLGEAQSPQDLIARLQGGQPFLESYAKHNGHGDVAKPLPDTSSGLTVGAVGPGGKKITKITPIQ
jgi:hypothetical protein